MWPFRRSSRASRPPQQVYRAGPGAWRALDPMPIVQAQTLATFDVRFQDSLATWSDPSFLAPLGHHVVPGAPSGTVGGLAVSAPRTFAPAPRMPPPQISYGVDATDEWSPAPDVPSAGPADVEHPVAPHHEAAGTTSTAPLPTRPVVQPRRADPLTALTRSTTAAGDRPAAAVQRSATAAPPPIDPAAADAPLIPDAPPTPEAVETTPVAPLIPDASPTPEAVETTADPPQVVGLVASSDVVRTAPATPASPARLPVVARTPGEPSPAPAAPRPAPHGVDVPVPRPRIGAPIDPAATTATTANLPRTTADLPRTSLEHIAQRSDPAVPIVAAGAPVPDEPAEPPAGAIQRALVGHDPVVAPTMARAMDSASIAQDSDVPMAPIGVPRGTERREDPADAVVPPTEPIGATPAAVVSTLGASSPAPIVQPTTLSLHIADDVVSPGVSTTRGGSIEPPARAPSVVAPSVQRVRASSTPLTVANVATGPPAPTTISRAATATATATATAIASEGGWADAPRRVGLLGERPVQRTSSPASVEATSLHDDVGMAPPAPGELALVHARPAVVPIVRDAAAPVTVAAQRAAPGTPRPSPATALAPSVDLRPPELAADGEPLLLQREPVDQMTAAPDAPIETATRAATASVGPAAPPDDGPRQPSDAEVQEMLHALYPSLRRRLSRDLLLDRERLGYRTDIRF